MKLIRSHFLCALILFVIFSPSVLVASESDSLVDFAWKRWNDNKRDLVEQSFLSAIQKDANNARAYIGLMLLYTLQEQNEKAWSVYKQAIEKNQNPYPYIYATWVTTMFRDNPNMENAGIVDLLHKLSEDQKAPPSMRAMAYENLGAYYERKHKLSKSEECYDGMHSITDWTLLGAFDNVSACGYDAIFPPETEYSPSVIYTGKHGSPATWFKVNVVRRDRWIDFERYFIYSDAIFYANTFVYSPVKQAVHIRVGTSGSLKTFLNDELVLSSQDETNNDLDTYIASTELQRGWNRILIKCGYSEISSCNFMLRITGPNGENVSGLTVSTEAHAYTSKPKAPAVTIENFAERFFIEQIKEHPDHFENYFLLADSYLRNDKAAEAEDVLRSGLRLLPRCSMFYYSLIETYNRGKKAKEIGEIYEELGMLDEKLPEVLTYRYSQFIANEQYDEAEQTIRELDSMLPKSELVYTLYLGLYGKKQQVDKIIAYTQDAYARYPWNWNFANLSAQIALETTKDFQPAVNIVKEYLEREYYATPLSTLSNFYLRWGKLDRYEAAVNDLLELDPASPGYYRSMGATYFQAQQYEKAADMFKKVLTLCPNGSDSWNLLGNCYRVLKKPDEAKDAFQQALSFAPTKYEARESIRELEGKPPIFSSFQSTDIAQLKKTTVSGADYPEDEAVYVLDDTRRVVYPKGASEYTREIAVKAFNSLGVDDFKEYRVNYNSYSETLTIEKAVVIKAQDHSEVKADIDQNHIVFKSFEAGDMIYIKWHVKNYYTGKMSDRFWDEIYMNDFYPKMAVRYSLLVPKDFAFTYCLQHADAKPVIDTLQEGLRYTWTMENLPSIKQEQDMSVLDDIGTILHISSIPNWNYIVQWYSDLVSDKTRSSFEIRQKVAELFNDKPNLTDEEKIRVIYDFITEKIRYSSVSFRQSSYIPQRARDVLVQRIGDCKDMATLGIAMLKEIGIPAYHVLVKTRDEGKNRDALPSPAFNHCIVAAETPSGIKYIDLTAYNYSMESVPYMDQDAFALVIRPGVKEPFYLSDSLFSPKNIVRTTLMTVKPDNSAFIDRSSTRTGTLAGDYRNRLRNKGKKDVEKEIATVITSDYNTAELKDYEFRNLDTSAPTLFYRFSFLAPNCVTETGGVKIFKIMWADKLGTKQALSYDNRTFPYEYYPGTDTLREEMTITLPSGYVPVGLVPSTSVTSPFGKYSLTYSFTKGVIHGTREFIHQRKVISPSEYKDFKDFYNKVFREDDKDIALKKGK
jgi:tetratricopeptide (TPR) repeat protein